MFFESMTNSIRELIHTKNETPNPNFFGIHFCSIEIQIWRWYQAIDTYFWIQTLWGRGGGNQKFGRNPYFNFFFFWMSSLIPECLSSVCSFFVFRNTEARLVPGIDQLYSTNSWPGVHNVVQIVARNLHESPGLKPNFMCLSERIEKWS